MDERKKQALERAYARFLEQQAEKGESAEAIIEELTEVEAEAPIVEAPVVETPVVETPVQEVAPAEETPVAPVVEEDLGDDIINLSTFDILSAINDTENKEEQEAMSFAELILHEEATEIAEEASEPVVTLEELTEEEPEKVEPEKTKKEKLGKKAKKEKKEKGEKKEYGYYHPVTLMKDFVLAISFLGDGMASLIDVHDVWQAKSDVVLIDMGKSLVTEYHNMLQRYRLSRKRIASSVLYMTLISCAMLLVFDYFTVYEYAYNGRVLGYVDDQRNVTDVLDVAGSQLSKNNEVQIEFRANDNITFKQVPAADKTVDDSDTVVNKIAYMTDIEVNAYGIYEDGQLVTIVESEGVAQRTLNAVMAAQSKPDEGMELISAKFLNPINVQPVTVMLTSVQTPASAQVMTTKGGSFEIYHIVNNGETIASIAETFGVDKSEVLDPDTGKAAAGAEVGDKILIRKMVSPIKVKMVEDGTMSEIIPYQTITENTDKLYKGDKAVKQEGIDGKQIITGKVTKVNGEITKRNLTNTEVITQVQNKIILIGTAKRPKTAPTGVFGMPIRNYTLTSRVGARWGRIHQGLDLAAPTGTPIYASDGGTVTISGWQGGYGNVIYIDHGNGYETRYGHNSRLLVPAGTKVYKGQQIALCGSTGNSTGPHLHFEIRYHGEYRDAGKILGLY